MAGPDYPRHLHKPDGSTCLVTNDDDKAAKLAEGWNLWPGDTPLPRPTLTHDELAAPIADTVKAVRKKKG